MGTIGPHPAEAAEQRYCLHADCKVDTFDEMMLMACVLDRRNLVLFAAQCLMDGVQVRCRRVPRKGPIHAPLPPRRAGALA